MAETATLVEADGQTEAAAERGKITEAALDELRAEIGREYPIPQYNHSANLDAVTHFMLGMGDDNPLFMDPSHAGQSRWGSVIAPPMFVMSCGFPRSRGLPGVHGLFTGVDLICHEPIRVGTTVVARNALHRLDERHGRFAGQQFQQTSATTYRDESGKPLSTLYSHNFRTERSQGKKTGKYNDLTRAQYDEAGRAAIEAQLREEKRRRRGPVPRFFEEVSVGDIVPGVIKGPLTVTDCICFLMGFGYIYVKAHRQAFEFRERHPGVGVLDKFGVWDIPERVHWDEHLAQEIGMPAAYDYGPQRIGWFGHCVTDWAGDDAFVRRLTVKVTGPNFIGDTTTISGTVTEKNEETGTVTMDLRGVDQRGRVHSSGSSEVQLPRRGGA